MWHTRGLGVSASGRVSCHIPGKTQLCAVCCQRNGMACGRHANIGATQRAVCRAFHLPVLWMALVVNCYKVCALYKWY